MNSFCTTFFSLVYVSSVRGLMAWIVCFYQHWSEWVSMFSPVDMASLPSWKIWDRRDSQLATEEIAVRGEYMMKLEQLQRLCSENTPTAPWLPILLIHSGSQVKTRQSQSYKFQEFAKNSFFLILKQSLIWPTLWSCLIRCVKMKWIWRVLLKIDSGHDFVHRWTDRLTDRQTR